MSGNVRSDLVMLFTDKSGGPVWAESTLDVAKADPMMKGFNPITEYDDYSNFFEVTSFNFSVALRPNDQGVGSLSQASQGPSSVAPAAQDQFSRWRSAKADEYKKILFPLEFDTFSFSRVIDGASPVFFNACCNQESFKTAALVKRVAVGDGDSVRHTLGFLRLDFRDVLLTGVNWDDGDMVTESCTFICKAMRVRYRAQMAQGSLEQATEANWDQQKDGSASSSGGR
jgi:type VI protein secretion system component Hcp